MLILKTASGTLRLNRLEFDNKRNANDICTRAIMKQGAYQLQCEIVDLFRFFNYS